MAQHDYALADQPGAAFLSDLNNALAAIVSMNSGASAPATTYPYQIWADTTTGLLKVRNAANSAWIQICELATGAPSASTGVVGGVVSTVKNTDSTALSYAKYLVQQASVIASFFSYNNTYAFLGTESNHPLYIFSNYINRLLVDTTILAVNADGLGYGSGSGGAVTQSTSKSTAVTLNKPCGVITMNNALLVSGGAAVFLLYNSVIGPYDTVTVHKGSVGTNGNSYDIRVTYIATGGVEITVRNIGVTNLSEAIDIIFQVHKGAVS